MTFLFKLKRRKDHKHNLRCKVDTDNIVPGTDGLYALCFKNLHSKSKEELLQIFGRYGNVQSVRFAGPNPSGLVFIRYKEYEEIVKCLEDMRRTKEFNVNMAYRSGKFKDSKGNKFTPQINSQRNFQKKPDENNMAGFNDNDCYKQNFRSVNNDQKVKGNFPRKTMQQRDSENFDTRSQKSNSSSKHSDCAFDGPPPLIQANDLPPLLDTNDIPALVDKQTKVKAVDIVLANFPLKTSDVEIFALARDCGINVVGISKTEITGIKFNIPYCHLWLDCLYDADFAESKLNGLPFHGRRLVAVKTHSLLSDN